MLESCCNTNTDTIESEEMKTCGDFKKKLKAKGWVYREAAKLINVSPGTINSIMNKADDHPLSFEFIQKWKIFRSKS